MRVLTIEQDTSTYAKMIAGLLQEPNAVSLTGKTRAVTEEAATRPAINTEESIVILRRGSKGKWWRESCYVASKKEGENSRAQLEIVNPLDLR